jgi:alkylglycerol monooxygenase
MATLYLIVLSLNFAILFGILIEFLYSKKRKDGVYTFEGTFGNIVNGIILILVTTFFAKLYTEISVLWYMYANFTPGSITLLNVIFCLMCVDFCYYIFHRLHHSNNFLWTLHSVHHSDSTMNLSTSYRISWLEHAYFLLFFAPVVLVGFNISLIIFSIYFLSIYQAFCHSQYIQYPHFLEKIFITPQNHLIHHNINRKYYDNNYSGIFSIWDHLFGTFYSGKHSSEDVSVGITNYKENNCFKYQVVPLFRYIKLKYFKKTNV